MYQEKYFNSPPAITIPRTTPPSLPSITKKPNSKPLQVKDGVTTARDLCVVKYFATHPDTHPDATESDFAATWKSYDAETKKAKKNEIEPTQDTQSHVASISSSGMIKLTFRHRKDRFGSVWIVV
ncbi:hypothetical protein E4T56_gene19547 [Termitomyces sp. T112]|nr:hypothetical protein E4T56_gene19547 [Termitomyces sp. T112]